MAYLKVFAVFFLAAQIFSFSVYGQITSKNSEAWLNKAGITIENLLQIPRNGGIQTKKYQYVNGQWLLDGIFAVTYKDSLKMKSGYSAGFNLVTPSCGDVFTNNYDINRKMIKRIHHGVSSIVYSYNNSGLLSESIESTLSGFPIERILKTYDNDANLIESKTQVWKNSWLDSIRTISSYNASKQLTMQTIQNWNSSSSIWEDKQKYNLGYSQTGLISVLEIKNWAGSTWANWRRISYNYNSSGLVSSAVTENYSLGNWRNYEMINFEYSADNKLRATVQMDWSGSAWSSSAKDSFIVKEGKFIQILTPLPKLTLNNNIPVSWIASGVNKIDVHLLSPIKPVVVLAMAVRDTGDYCLSAPCPEMYNSESAVVKIYDSEDSSTNSLTEYNLSIRSPFVDIIKTGWINVNHLYIRVNNSGSLGNDKSTDTAQIKYDGLPLIHSSGFFLSWLANGEMRGNGEFSSSRVSDYIPGNTDIQGDSLLYPLKKRDVPFGNEWSYWKDAVSYGAFYYDGDGNNSYEPIDLNGNGKWDMNEDCPGSIGDISYWCVYNDGTPKSMRRYNDVSPQGIEVRQTVFAPGKMNTVTDGAVFIRYTLINKSASVNTLDSVYFAAALDPDIGNNIDDLVGSDTVLNCGFAFDKGPDTYYGANPPAIIVDLLQGPVVFLPGETFTDINGNGSFDPGVDVPLDTAWQKYGPIIGQKAIPGAKNLGMTSFTQFMQSHPTHGDPNTRFELRNYMLGGRGKDGRALNPCMWSYGNGGPYCASINPKFMYSGDPITRQGWLNTVPEDQKMLVNSGPFKLERNQPIDIIVAYIVKRSSISGLHSLTLAKQADIEIKQIYKSNFTDLPSDIRSEGNLSSAREFKLYSNYPNPFNPSTSIGFYLPRTCKVNLKVYDILGREVAVLVNGEMTAGPHNVNFNALNIAGGVYFYSLKADGYSETRKMLLLK